MVLIAQVGRERLGWIKVSILNVGMAGLCTIPLVWYGYISKTMFLAHNRTRHADCYTSKYVF